MDEDEEEEAGDESPQKEASELKSNTATEEVTQPASVAPTPQND
jgi:hypothetical protein